MRVTSPEQPYYLIVTISLVAVVVLFFLLLMQIRKSNRIRRDDTAIRLRRQFMDLQLAIARNEDLAGL